MTALELLRAARARALAGAYGMVDLIAPQLDDEERIAFDAIKAALDPIHSTQAASWSTAERLRVLDAAIARLEASSSAPGRPPLHSGAAGRGEVRP